MATWSTRARARRRTVRSPVAVAVGGVLLAVVLVVGIGTLFAGSPRTLAEGTTIAGVDVGGLSPGTARKLLEQRFERVQRVPVHFVADGKRFDLLAVELGVEPDFAGAVEAARAEGDGFGPLRGYRRLRVRLSEQDVQPRVSSWDVAVRRKLRQIAERVDRTPREPAIVRRGLSFAVERGSAGHTLDTEAARAVVVSSLAGFERGTVTLPMRHLDPKVRTEELEPALHEARRAVSAPVRLVIRARAYRLPRWRVAQLLELPSAGRTGLRIGGRAADGYFRRLARAVDSPPRDARFAVDGPRVRIVPSRPGLGLDGPASARAILAAATTPGSREAHLVTEQTRPALTTAQARTMGIVGLVSSYETIYGGDSNRRHNVQLVAHLVDGHLIKPGEEFSFNGTTGERTAEKGFLEAPVIINGELQTGLGGGVCQVSTTVFNAAFDAGLPITARTNHALYISHYPLGRDATVDYPGVDLKFVNDTGHWLLLRTFVGSSSLVVNLYGTDPHRKVEVETAPLRVVAPAPLERVEDPTLAKGEVVVEEWGVPAQATSVRRRVLAPSGKLLYDSTWVSNYRAEPKVVRIGAPPPAETTTGATTTTAPTETTPTTGTTTTNPTSTTPTTTRPRQSPPSTTTAPASAAG